MTVPISSCFHWLTESVYTSLQDEPIQRATLLANPHPVSFLTPALLKDSRTIDMTTNAPGTIRRRAGEEESPAIILLGQLTDLLEIQHLAERHPPQGQNILVQVVRLGGGPALKRGGITADGAEVAVVQPVLHGLLLLDARPLRGFGVRVAVAAQGEARVLLRLPPVEVFGPAGSDQEDVADLDVAALGRWADVDPLVLAHEH